MSAATWSDYILGALIGAGRKIGESSKESGAGVQAAGSVDGFTVIRRNFARQNALAINCKRFGVWTWLRPGTAALRGANQDATGAPIF